MEVKPLEKVSIKGSIRKCGEEYGEFFCSEIPEFLQQEITRTPERIEYSRKCLEQTKRYAPNSMKFMKGIARGADMSLEEVTMLTLHEEFLHKPHCTGMLAKGKATKNGKGITGMNWDWWPEMLPWPGILELKMNNKPKTMAYQYPGLWNSAGINDQGLGLVWTGAGYWPEVKCAIGVPTYALISEVLLMKDVRSASKYLEKTPRAGCFIFLIADSNDGTIIEGMPSVICSESVDDVYTRANHYETSTAKKLSRQKLDSRVSDTSQRAKIIAKLAHQNRGSIDIKTVKKILMSERIYTKKDDPEYARSFVTMDHIICEGRTLHVKRAWNENSRWKTYSL